MNSLLFLALTLAPAALDDDVARALFESLDTARGEDRDVVVQALGSASTGFLQAHAAALIDRADRARGEERTHLLRVLLSLKGQDWPAAAKAKSDTLSRILDATRGEAGAYAAVCYARSEPPLKTAVYKLIERAMPRPPGRDSDWARAGGLQGLGELGPRAYPLFEHILTHEELEPIFALVIAEALLEAKADATPLLPAFRVAQARATGQVKAQLSELLPGLSGAGLEERVAQCRAGYAQKSSWDRYRCLRLLDKHQADIGPDADLSAFLVQRLDDPDDGHRRLALSALAHIAPKEQHPALAPKVAGQLSTGLGYTAGLTLLALGTPGQDALRRALDAPDRSVRTEALGALGTASRAHPLPASWAPLLCRLARTDKDPGVRGAAADVLARTDEVIARHLAAAVGRESHPHARASLLRALAARGEAAVPTLRRRLQEPLDVSTAAYLLGELGPGVAGAAVPDLAAALGRHDEVGKALAKLGPRGLSALAGGLYDNHAKVRAAAARGLGRAQDQAAAPHVADLGAALLDGDRDVRFAAALTLRGLAEHAGPAALDLEQALRSDDYMLPQLAAETLHRLFVHGHEDDALQARFGAWVQKRVQGKRVPDWAVAALPVLPPEQARPLLLQALGDDDDRVRAAAARALGQLPAPTPAVRAALRGALDDDKSGVRGAAAQALLRVGGREDRVRALVVIEKRKHEPLRLMTVEVPEW